MSRLTVRFFLAVCLLFGTMSHAAESGLKTWGYVVHWMGDTWREAKIEQFDRLLFFEIKIGARGEVVDANGWPDRWQALKGAAKSANRPLDITLTLFSAEAFNHLFSNFEATQNFVKTALVLASEEGVAGLHLDVEIYEGATALALSNYQTFVTDLATQLANSSPSRQLSVFYPIGGQAPLYEPLTLRHLSAVVFQGYDAHWSGGKQAGPVAPLKGEYALNWERIFALSQLLDLQSIPVLISFPLFGYEWPVRSAAIYGETKGVGEVTTFAPVSPEFLPNNQINIMDRFAKYGATYDLTSGSAYYTFSPRKGEWREGWFEDWWTLNQKINHLCEKHLSGVAFFPLGYDRNYLVDFYLQRRTCQN